MERRLQEHQVLAPVVLVRAPMVPVPAPMVLVLAPMVLVLTPIVLVLAPVVLVLATRPPHSAYAMSSTALAYAASALPPLTPCPVLTQLPLRHARY